MKTLNEIIDEACGDSTSEATRGATYVGARTALIDDMENTAHLIMKNTTLNQAERIVRGILHVPVVFEALRGATRIAQSLSPLGEQA